MEGGEKKQKMKRIRRETDIAATELKFSIRLSSLFGEMVFMSFIHLFISI